MKPYTFQLFSLALILPSLIAGCSSATENADSGLTSGVDGDASSQVCTPSPRLRAGQPLPYLGNIYRSETNTDERFHQLWNQVTPENAAKWNAVESTRNVMTWLQLDNAVAFADNFDYPFKFHVLLAGDNEPSWFSTLSTADQEMEIVEWMDQLATRYPNLEQVEVIAEPLNMTPQIIEALGGAGETGWDWVIRAFELARERFPNSELILNDYKIDSDADANANYIQLVDTLHQKKLIDGIGVEGHFLEMTTAGMVSLRLDALTRFELPVYVSDLDINLADDQLQLVKMQELFPTFYEHPNVAGLTLWGYRENQLWQSDAYLLSRDEVDRPALDWLECYTDLNN